MFVKSAIANLGAALSGALILGVATFAWATPATFTNEASWASALPSSPPIVTQNFNTFPSGPISSDAD